MSILGIDYGTKRIGLALAEEGSSIAFRHGIIETGKSPLKKLKEIINEEKVNLVVLGLPKFLSGQIAEMGDKAMVFGKAIEDMGLRVEYCDERFTSQEAERNVGTKDKVKINAEAARIILQSYLDKN